MKGQKAYLTRDTRCLDMALCQEYQIIKREVAN